MIQGVLSFCNEAIHELFGATLTFNYEIVLDLRILEKFTKSLIFKRLVKVASSLYSTTTNANKCIKWFYQISIRSLLLQ